MRNEGEIADYPTFTVTDSAPVFNRDGQVGMLLTTAEAGHLAFRLSLAAISRLRAGLAAAETMLTKNPEPLVVTAAVRVSAQHSSAHRPSVTKYDPQT
jgi:hypothetical protein